MVRNSLGYIALSTWMTNELINEFTKIWNETIMA
jgi:hypothetical protein